MFRMGFRKSYGSKGVVYVALDRPDVALECLCSLKSLRESGYTGAASVVTNIAALAGQLDHFDATPLTFFPASPVLPTAWPGREVRTRLFEISPYQQTLHLETDTICRGDVSPIFDLLANSNGDLLAVPNHLYAPANLGWHPGVFLWNRSKRTSRFFKSWHKVWHERGAGEDESPFWAACLETNVRIRPLPICFNWTLNVPNGNFIPGVGKVVIQHAHLNTSAHFENYFGDFYRSTKNDFGVVTHL